MLKNGGFTRPFWTKQQESRSIQDAFSGGLIVEEALREKLGCLACFVTRIWKAKYKVLKGRLRHIASLPTGRTNAGDVLATCEVVEVGRIGVGRRSRQVIDGLTAVGMGNRPDG